MKVTYRGKEVEPGFYAEENEIRTLLAEMMEDIGENDISSWLIEEPSDTYEEETLAIEKLDDNTEGGYWRIEQGLYLVAEGSELDQAIQAGA